MPEGRHIPHHGEAIVLRTWPFHEADLLVSLFTREQGKVKGVARHAMKSRRRFGGALEPATHVLAHYTERPRQDLVRLDQFEILWSPLSEPIDTPRLAALQLITEVLEEALPEQAADDNIFRLALTVLTSLNSGCPPSGLSDVGFRDTRATPQIYLPITYFCLWMNRLLGWMPELGHCAACGLHLADPALRGEAVWWSPTADGVTCHDDRRPGSRALSAASVAESHRIGRAALAELAQEEWPARRAADLRAFAIGTLERHLERRLRSALALN
jgi:DNA repair protein RecO (recombination protein O)